MFGILWQKLAALPDRNLCNQFIVHINAWYNMTKLKLFETTSFLKFYINNLDGTWIPLEGHYSSCKFEYHLRIDFS